MSQGIPRKFSEKIAILERKQNEEQEMFRSVMRDVRAITNNKTSYAAASPISTYPCSLTSKSGGSSGFSDAQCSTVPSEHSPSTLTANSHSLSFSWNRPGGSLPNVHQMVEQQPFNDYPSWNNVTPSIQNHQVRTRSPGAHYHPYINRNYPVGQKNNERVPPLENHIVKPSIHLQPPDPTWSRARSDPTIHINAMFASTDIYHQQQPSVSTAENSMQWNSQPFVYRNPIDGTCAFTSFPADFSQYPEQQQLSIYNNSVQQSDFLFELQQQQQLQLSNQNSTQQHCLNNVQSLNSQQNTFNNDIAVSSHSKMRSPLPNINYNECTPILSLNQTNMTTNNVLNNRNPVPAPVTYNTNINYQQLQNNSKITSDVLFLQRSFNNQQLGTADINSSQSAPTSPAQGSAETQIKQQWPSTRHYSTSPDTLDIPNIVLTGADGTLDCFQDLQNLHLDNEIQQLLNNPNGNEQMDLALETQLLN